MKILTNTSRPLAHPSRSGVRGAPPRARPSTRARARAKFFLCDKSWNFEPCSRHHSVSSPSPSAHWWSSTCSTRPQKFFFVSMPPREDLLPTSRAWRRFDQFFKEGKWHFWHDITRFCSRLPNANFDNPRNPRKKWPFSLMKSAVVNPA